MKQKPASGLFAFGRARGRRASASRLAMLAAGGVLLCAAMASASDAATQQRAASAAPIVQTENGPVRGMAKDGMAQFLGIPYAAPPVGALRWRPPIAPAGWKAPLPTVKYAPICAQNNTSFPDFATASDSEDCLYLNVYKPAGADARKPLPVFVWLYGGGLFMGGTDDYDPGLLVKQGKLIFVSMNYRVALFGFFSHPAINAEGHEAGNYGIMDQQFALEWVKHNIARFGGDPANVTIAGESAGGFGVWAHLVSPKSTGLYQRGIVESGSSIPVVPTATLEARAKVGQDVAVAAGCPDQTAACLRALPAKAILAANVSAPKVWGAGHFPSGLMVDGRTIPASLDQLFVQGKFNKVPVINGTNQSEFNWFQAMQELVTGKVVTPESYARQVTAIFGPQNAAKILALYPVAKYDNASLALAAVMGDSSFICGGNRRINRIMQGYGAPVYQYEFAVPDSPVSWKPVSFAYGSAHTAELQYLFPGFHGATGTVGTLSASQKRLAQQMVGYWSNFAHGGTPNGPAAGLPTWAAYDPAKDNFLALKTSASSMQQGFGMAHQCDTWDQLNQR